MRIKKDKIKENKRKHALRLNNNTEKYIRV